MIIRKANFSLLLFLFMVGNFLLFAIAIHSSSLGVFFFHWAVLLASVMVILFLSPKWSYIVISALTVLYGFLLCYFSYLQTVFNQVQLISLFISYVLSVVPLLFIRHSFLSMDIRMKELLAETVALRKYMDSDGLMLTKQEFYERSKITLRGMNRRNETGFLLKVSGLNSGVTQKAWQGLIQNVIEETMRSDFDFFMSEGASFIIFLQNTNEEGVIKFQNRLVSNLRQQMNMIQPPIEFRDYAIVDFDEVYQMLLEEKSNV
ncbi:hypothetical protein LCM23_23455 [Cytobacillus kochii]|uniref:hypothetical protein n=1 Tax=Cytobacillus kochii TaxID=859143 RepID=UPI001CD24F2C|nr:hypothetical protein [Cytobacillus kochii]MCA1028996.1 hypothetical protein [Cytobacillus kochii]